MNWESAPKLRWVLGVVLAVIVIGGTTDLVLDRPASWRSLHVLMELSLIGGALVLSLLLWLGWWRSARSVTRLQEALAEQRAERDAWRARAQHALTGLGQAIGEQLSAWSLTPAESEVALLLLKGYSHKRIAKLTGRSEATVRQHAAAVYHKSGLAGRAELAAFFLEDLILPEAARRHE